MTPRYRHWLAVAPLFAAFIVVGSLALAAVLHTSRAVTRISIDAAPIAAFDSHDPARTRFGALEFRGGLALTSDNAAFGGISAIHLAGNGAHFLSVTDNGSWLRGRITYRDGKPSGIADAEMAPMLGGDGKPLAARGWFDAESLAELGGQFYVGLERVQKIVRFDVKRRGLTARGEAIPVPPDFKHLSYNKSLECLAAGPAGSGVAGRLIVVTEHSLDAAGNFRGFLLKGEAVGRFSVKRHGDFDVSDCTILPPADLLLLERSYSPARGVAMRIRRIPLSAIKPGALADGESLIEVDLNYQIDNMEGIAVSRNAAGETILTLVSDDNFSAIQRNLLLQFKLVD